MGMLHIFSERGDEAKKFDEHMEAAYNHFSEACRIWNEMKSQLSERGGSDMDQAPQMRSGDSSYRMRDTWGKMDERSRDSRGRWI